jgi:crotonobetainyl-CoA:carnitine CoA-transferase CaiB-like acyl-CoA transferase
VSADFATADPGPDAALDGIRVVDFGQYLPGPMVGMFLADFGADVIRVDPPGGPRWKHAANAMLQRGKRAIELDLKTSADRGAARQLISSADVVIENFRPGVMSRLGLAPESFLDAPQLIWCSIPGFGKDDRRAALAGWEGIVASAAGLYPPNYKVEGGPCFTALPLASNFGAFVASHRILAALIGRHRYGRGQYIEVPLFEAAFEMIATFAEIPMSRALFEDRLLERLMRDVITFHQAKDGRWIDWSSPKRGVQALLDECVPGTDLLAIDEDELERVRERLESVWGERTAAEWERYLQERLGACSAAVQTTAEWLNDRHALASECVVEVDDPELGPTRQGGFPVRLSLAAGKVRWPRRIPDSDRHEILAALASLGAPPSAADAAESEIIRLTSTDGAGERNENVLLPLAGLRVVDASILLAGPSTTRVLAQYGAEVIKIEKPSLARDEVDPLSDEPACLVGHRTVNAGKRMMFLDLKAPEGAEILRSMVRTADVVHHNFGAETAARLGLAVDQVRTVQPSVIYSTVSCHSHGGYREKYRGHDNLGQSVAGITHRLGGGGRPRKSAIFVNDHATGHLGALGVLLALFHRYRTGRTQEVNAALSRTSTMHQVPFMVDFDGQTWNEPSGPDVHGWGPFDRLYRTSDGWMYLVDRRRDAPTHMTTALSVLGFSGDIPTGEVERELERVLAEHSTDDCIAAVSEVGGVAHRYENIIDVILSDDAVDKGYSAILDHPGLGPALGIGIWTRPMTGRAGARLLPARRPGSDTLDVLAEQGMESRAGELLRKKVVAIGENPVVTVTKAPGYFSAHRNIPALAEAESLKSAIQAIVRSTQAD